MTSDDDLMKGQGGPEQNRVDRRQTARVEVDRQALVTHTFSEALLSGTVVNLSREGLSMVLAQPLAPGYVVDIELVEHRPGVTDDSINLRGEVVYALPADSGRYRVGVRLSPPGLPLTLKDLSAEKMAVLFPVESREASALPTASATTEKKKETKRRRYPWWLLVLLLFLVLLLIPVFMNPRQPLGAYTALFRPITTEPPTDLSAATSTVMLHEEPAVSNDLEHSNVEPDADEASTDMTASGDGEVADWFAADVWIADSTAFDSETVAAVDGQGEAEGQEQNAGPSNEASDDEAMGGPTEADKANNAPTDGIWLEVSKSEFALRLYRGQQLVDTIPVGLGQAGATPEGNYVIINKLTDPDWFRQGEVIPAGDPRNEIGHRWMGLGKGGQATSFGLHPSQRREDVGRESSRGCIRLTPEDAERLFRLCPVGTPVRIGQ